MNEIRRTPEFDQWLDGLKDKQGQHRIQARILRLGLGLMGDVKPVREGISEIVMTHPILECPAHAC